MLKQQILTNTNKSNLPKTDELPLKSNLIKTMKMLLYPLNINDKSIY